MYLIKKLIKSNFLYILTSRLYKSTNFHKKKVKKNEEVNKIAQEKQRAFERGFLKTVYRNGTVKILNGPFSGMKYLSAATGSQLIPKLIGSYEEPLQRWIKNAINNQYEVVIDIGCAEGYYAIGFSLAIANAKVIAYDNNNEAILMAKRMAEINLQNKIIFRDLCSCDILSSDINGKTLIFCDIEGAELELLNPKACKNLTNADIIVETHECFVPGVINKLIDRFYISHAIEIVYDYPGRLLHYNIPNFEFIDINQYFDEKRPPKMSWLFMKSLSARS